jgi:hypothetical protein
MGGLVCTTICVCNCTRACACVYMCVTCVIWVYACEPVTHIHTCMTGKFEDAVTLAISNPGDLTNKGAKSPSAFVASSIV